ncbi:MAG: hypothetical protein JO243_05640 [Solirubrobacterales bacterium]|nr:hypothetical protein [Solirubrobacterales bacterium]
MAAPRDAGATVIVMVFLMSDECPCMSGAEIAVDGGFSSCTSAEALSDALSD